MKDLYVQPDTLNDIATRMNTMHSKLSSAKGTAGANRDHFGHSGLADAFDNFSDRWTKVAGDIGDDVKELSGYLSGAGDLYSQNETNQSGTFTGGQQP